MTTLVRQPHYTGGRCADKLEEYTAVLGNRASLDSITGTYYGVLPPDIKTTLTLNADGTYRLKQKSENDSDSCEVLNEIFKVLDDNNVLMLIHPSSGDNIFYMIKSNNCNILMDSFGNEPPKEKVKYYVLKRD